MKDEWLLSYEDYEPESEGLREALCTLGNGYFATRGAALECDANGTHYPGTYVACLYDRLTSRVAGRDVVNEDLVNVPNWLPLRFRIAEGQWFSPETASLTSYRQQLDMRRGLLTRSIEATVGVHAVRIEERRLVHMGHRHLAAIELTIVPMGFSGVIEVLSALDGTVENAGVSRYGDLDGRHLQHVESTRVADRAVCLVVETLQSKVRIAQAARTQAWVDDVLVETPRITVEREGYVADSFSVRVESGQRLRIEKVVSLFTSRDRAISEAAEEASKHVTRARGFADLVSFHALAWEHLWKRFRIELAGSDRASLVANLHVFHLLQTASVHGIDQDIGVPARGWHGEAYRGHVFWDELFIFPFINMHQPEIVRSLLLYRYRRLPEARFAAYEAGRAGAMYPWQSGSNGREETQVVHLNPRSGEWVPDNSHRQRHISSAVAYNVWKYFEATADLEFLSFYGAEMMLEIARFWASMAEWDEGSGRYSIRGVMGPDEYHEGYPWDDEPRGVDNNAYTNVMAVWVLLRALETLELLPLYRRIEITEQLELTAKEIERWEDITRKTVVCFHDGGIISQFEGYERLEEFDWDGYRSRYGDISRLDRILGAEGDSADRYKLSKQADVLMLFYLFSTEELATLFHRLGYVLTPEMVEANIAYYLQRTSHGSTLSGVVHAWVLARLDRERSWSLFKESLESDIGDVQGGTTSEGIHLGAMAGTVDIIQRGYAGIETRDGVLHLDPVLPREIEVIRLHVRYRGQWLDIEIAHEGVVVRADAAEGSPIHLGVDGVEYEITPGDELRFDIREPRS